MRSICGRKSGLTRSGRQWLVWLPGAASSIQTTCDVAMVDVAKVSGNVGCAECACAGIIGQSVMCVQMRSTTHMSCG